MCRARSRRVRRLFVLGLLAVSFNLRPSIVSVSPVLEAIRADLGLSYTALSLLTTLPVLCLGVFAFAAPGLARRLGRVRSVGYGAVLVALATAVRVVADPLVLFASALAVGVGMAVCQTVLPALVSEFAPQRAAGVTGLYSASMIGGAAVAAGLTAPLAQRLGEWTLALAVWALPAAVGVLAWGGLSLAVEDAGDIEREAGDYPWGDRSALAAVAFFGGLAVVFFSAAAWIPPRYVALGMGLTESGVLLSVFFAGALVGSLVLSAVGDRTTDRRPWFALTLAATLLGAGAMTLVPMLAPSLWALSFGFGAGGLFPLGMTLPVDLGADTDAAGRLSAMIFGVGYLLGAAGPLTVGALRDLLGSFVVPFAGLVAVTLAMCVAALRFAPRHHGSVE